MACHRSKQLPYVLPATFPLNEDEAVILRQQIDALGVPLSLIIPDTAASVFPGDEENKTIDLTDDEFAAVIAALKEKLDRDRYPRAPRLEPIRAALAKLDPTSAPRPAAPPRPPLPQATRTRGPRARR